MTLTRASIPKTPVVPLSISTKTERYFWPMKSTMKLSATTPNLQSLLPVDLLASLRTTMGCSSCFDKRYMLCLISFVRDCELVYFCCLAPKRSWCVCMNELDVVRVLRCCYCSRITNHFLYRFSQVTNDTNCADRYDHWGRILILLLELTCNSDPWLKLSLQASVVKSLFPIESQR